MVAIYDIEITGHHLDYLRYLAQYLLREKAEDFLFIVHQGAPEAVTELMHFPRIEVTKAQISSFNRHPLGFPKALRELLFLRTALAGRSVKELIFLFIDDFLPVAFLLGSPFPFPVKGILFRPPFRDFASLEKKDGRNLRRRIKLKIKERLLFESKRNWPDLRLFILNDLACVAAYNTSGRAIFRYLPDPITADKLLPLPSDTLETGRLPETQQLILCFGSIDARKNVPRAIEAMRFLPPETQRTSTLWIVGKSADDALEATILQTIENVTHSGAAPAIRRFNQFVGEAEKEALFARADAVLVPYVDFYYSSGILGYAAKYNAPVIGPEAGLLPELIAAYDLGVCVNPYDPHSIAGGIEKSLKTRVNGEKYVRDHTPEAFAQTLLGTR